MILKTISDLIFLIGSIAYMLGLIADMVSSEGKLEKWKWFQHKDGTFNALPYIVVNLAIFASGLLLSYWHLPLAAVRIIAGGLFIFAGIRRIIQAKRNMQVEKVNK
jgi:hypothetical protein